MQFNESTYETIFLLYIDNELSPKARLEVEALIADNPSYALEMEALKATLLRPENVTYAFKENLKKQALETSVEGLKEDLVED
jgi:anti-sigma factor RsiW